MAVHQELPGERHPEQTRARRHVLLAQLAAPLRNFLQTEAGSAGLLLAATALALVWANSPWSDLYTDLWATSLTVRISDHELAMDLEHWVNDGLMVIFFFVVGLELRRELSVGQLTDRRALILPALGAIGGLVVPSLLYILLNPTGEASRGWGIVIGTDTAFLLGALALVGPALSTQLRVFLLTMTIIDDVFAVTIIGVFYSESVDLVALAIAIVAVAGFALLDRLNVWRTSLYGVCGLVLWIATIESGLHPSIAGVAAGLTMAAYAPRREAVEHAASLFHAFRQSPSPGAGYSVKVSLQRVVSVNERLQEVLHPWTSYYIVPLFALANAGIDLRGGVLGDALQSAVTWGIVLGLVGGKVAGIGITTLGGERLGLGSFPRGVGHGHVLGGAALSGIGFTVSLLIANLAFTSSQLQAEATIGVLIAAVLSLLLGWLVFHLSALLHGEDAATLPLVLDPPVDPSRDHIRGPTNAPLTLVEYADFECPFCGEATDVIEELFERFGNDLQFVFRHLPLTDAHPRAELAALAAEAAAEQGRFWEMHDLLFEHQDALEWEDLLGYAAMAGLDLDAFRDAISGEEASRRVREDVESAEASGAQGTPTFFIGSRRHTGEHDAETLARELIASRTASEVAGEH